MRDENMNASENNSKPVQIDSANFDSEVLNSKQPVWSRS